MDYSTKHDRDESQRRLETPVRSPTWTARSTIRRSRSRSHLREARDSDEQRQHKERRSRERSEPRSVRRSGGRSVQCSEPRSVRRSGGRSVQGSEPRSVRRSGGRSVQRSESRSPRRSGGRSMQRSEPRGTRRSVQRREGRSEHRGKQRSEHSGEQRSARRSEHRGEQRSHYVSRRSQQRSEERSKRRSEQRGNQGEQHDSEWRIKRRRDRSGRRDQRSCSPSFSTADVLKLIQSLKGSSGPTSQPENQSVHSSAKNLDYKNILPEFNPSTKSQRMDVWLKKVNECASVYGWDERTTVHFAMPKLQGLAKTWYESQNSILFSWTEWQEKLLSAFPYEQNYGQALEDMLKRRSKFNEPIEIYYYEKLALLNNCDITGRRAVDCIIHGISDRTSKTSALALRCSLPDQLLQFLLSNKESTSQITFKNRSSIGNNAQNDRSRSVASTELICFNCKAKGHVFSQCPKSLKRCSRCNKIGHATETCFINRFDNQGPARADVVHKTMCITSTNTNSKYIKEAFVNGVLHEAFVDFGSEVTLIRDTTLSNLGIQHDGQRSTLRGFGEGLVYSLGSVLLNLSIDDVSATVCCRVVKDHLIDRPLLVGQTYSEQPHIIVYKDFSRLQFLDVGSELPGYESNSYFENVVRVRAAKSTKLYGAASIVAATEPVLTASVLLDSTVIGKPNEQFFIHGGMHKVTDGTLRVTVAPYKIPCLIPKGLIFSRAEVVEVVNRVAITSSGVDEDASISQESVKVDASVTDKDKSRLLQLLQDYRHCFAYDLSGLGCTNTTEMKIELSNQQPVVYRPYRLSHHERDKVRKMVGEMVEAGIVRESVSSYASPIILVKKKDGNIRMCVDYRKLNSITVKERYPMPIIDDEIARLTGQAWFITLDLMFGYYQVPIAEESRHLTAFVTPDGQYEFNRMPFGLANAPAVFQRMMNHVLGGTRFTKATVYIDDLLIYAETPSECLDRLEEVLKLLDNANLKLNLAKCSFLQNKIEYLGYEISSAGMRPSEVKIRSVVDFPRPENVHGVRQFLGLVSYFRKFIYGFAQIAHPLTKLLKKNTSWEWMKDQEESFKNLKSRLIDRPVLALYDPAAETELHTDASRIGVGGILLQRRNKNDPFHPVAYYSRQTTPEEKNFHSYELETLAVICSLRKFRVYLLGKEFRIITDCSALRSTFLKRDLIPRIARWWLALQEYDCSVEYRAGVKMSHVDALSRNPVDDPQSPEQFPTVMAISSDDWLLTLQLGDSELHRIRDILNCNLDEKGLDYIKNNYVLRNNKLFRYLEGDKDNVRWVVPKGARWQLCKMNHDDIGHMGIEKTLERIRRYYWFPKMSRFVKKYVRACIECAYAKRAQSCTEGLLHPIEKVDVPFHTLHIDHLGPFVKSKGGNSYILAVIDSFTKFVFIKPVRNTKTSNVIKVLTDIFDTFRTPDRLVSDRGSCFTSHAFRTFCLDRGVKHILNAVASPRSNGQIERYNRTILDALTAQNLKDDERGWDNKLGRIQWGLNNTVQKTIGRAPAEVLFGTAMNSESNPILNEIAQESRELDNLASIRDEVKVRTDREQLKQKSYYDKGRRPARQYRNGELVKITKTVFNNDGKSTKLMPTYEGPYRVIKTLGNDRYRVAPIAGFEGMKGKRGSTIAADRMRPWIHIAALEVNDDIADFSDDGNDESDMSE